MKNEFLLLEPCKVEYCDTAATALWIQKREGSFSTVIPVWEPNTAYEAMRLDIGLQIELVLQARKRNIFLERLNKR